MLRDCFPELSREGDGLAVDRHDDIARFQAAALARLARIHRIETRVRVRIDADLAEFDMTLACRHLGGDLPSYSLAVAYQVDGNFSIRPCADGDGERFPR